MNPIAFIDTRYCSNNELDFSLRNPKTPVLACSRHVKTVQFHTCRRELAEFLTRMIKLTTISVVACL